MPAATRTMLKQFFTSVWGGIDVVFYLNRRLWLIDFPRAWEASPLDQKLTWVFFSLILSLSSPPSKDAPVNLAFERFISSWYNYTSIVTLFHSYIDKNSFIFIQCNHLTM